LAFTELPNLCASVYFAGGRGPYGTELLVRELYADAHVLTDLGEGEIRLSAALRFVLAQAGAADLREIVQDLGESVAFR
jgi:hypothetical protein